MAQLQLLLLFVAITGSVVADKLQLSVLMFRHGDRSAIDEIPNDIYNSSSWPQGSGQLSTIGEESHLANGRFFRTRYTDPNQTTYLALDQDYKRVQVHARSTDKDRTLMSAESMLAGLFPPPASNRTSPFNVWQPIPVHTRPKNYEDMLGGDPVRCPAWKNHISDDMMKTEMFSSFMEEHTNTTNAIVELTGVKYTADQWNLMILLEQVYDTLFCEKTHNFALKPEFVAANLLERVKPYADIFWKSWNVFTPRLKSLSGGVLLRDLKQRISNSINQTDDIKLVLYSGHDTTLAAILTVLGVYDGVQPPYATVLMLELWERADGTHVVTLKRHHEDDELVTYKLPGCSDTGCTLEQFNSLSTELELTEEQFVHVCSDAWPDFVPGLGKNLMFVLFCVLILMFLSLTTTLLIYISRLRTAPRGVRYRSLA